MRQTLGLGLLGLVLAGASLAAEPASGVKVRNCEYWQTVNQGDFGNEPGALKPIALTGARNGVFSGQVVLTSGSALRGVKAKAGDLAREGGGGTIPASQVQVRFAAPATPDKCWLPAQRFDALLEAAPAEVPAAEAKATREFKPASPGCMAVLPVWVSVRVPRDAAPGEYKGRVTIEAAGAGPFEVPVEIRVAAMVLPDPADFTVKNQGMHSPDQLARHYGVPMWSDRHFQLMGRSLALMKEVGSRQATCNFTIRYLSQDNDETMVKWIKQADGSFKYDFTVFDRYLDLVDKSVGKPFPLRLNMWANTKEPLSVLVSDPAAGKVAPLVQPAYGTPEALAFWKPVLGEIRARLEKRKWVDVATANWHQYAGTPPPKLTSMFKQIWPDGKWSMWSHGRALVFPGETKEESMPAICTTSVWNEGNLAPYEKWDGQGPGPRAFKAGPKSNLGRAGYSVCGHARNRYYDYSPLLTIRLLNEEMLMRDQHGLDPVGADFWPVKDAKGRYAPGQWLDSCLGPGGSTMALLAPGPDGALPTERFEAMREGVQIAETMLFLQRALDSGKISGALAEKANKALDERALALITAAKVREAEHKKKSERHVLMGRLGWGLLDLDLVSKGARERDASLYAVAGEVAAALGGK
ncbi:MAG TPA: DUF6067 family protein [Planctomycetota bacterium]|nr:DUF6067 family protein [Planctomycetota bacterium]